MVNELVPVYLKYERTDNEPKFSHKQDLILQALFFGNTRTASAAAAGVHRDTFYEWMKNPTFSDAVEMAEAQAECRCVALIQQATITDWRAAAWWLERRKKAFRAEKLDVRRLSKDQIIELLEIATDGGDEEPGDNTAGETADSQ